MFLRLYICYLQATGDQEISDIVNKVKNDKAPGINNIGNYVIKGIIVFNIVDVLTYSLINVLKGRIPKCLKVAVVVPFHKWGGGKNNF